ncbi:hypothetical protein EJ08DRAFT_197422 [Tothia fuscella]|uniref:Uncharacterized protein n=1 Tax=Tothia fuscella TaxID=1048955 RepID=A0A9P4TZM5_9PEZI|nr:hypothetical protein EJ08DRAFT_197422 [Tothia fuscella]
MLFSSASALLDLIIVLCDFRLLAGGSFSLSLYSSDRRPCPVVLETCCVARSRVDLLLLRVSAVFPGHPVTSALYVTFLFSLQVFTGCEVFFPLENFCKTNQSETGPIWTCPTSIDTQSESFDFWNSVIDFHGCDSVWRPLRLPQRQLVSPGSPSRPQQIKHTKYHRASQTIAAILET